MRKHVYIHKHGHTGPFDGGALVNPGLGTGGSTGGGGGGSGSGATGFAGGDLSGSYPDPQVIDDSHNHTTATLPSSTERRILLADGRSTPFAFTDLLQMDDGSDFMYSDG